MHRPRLVSFILAALAALWFPASTTSAQPGRDMRLVVLGDSLSAGFMISRSTAFPAVLEATLRERGLPVSVADAAVSGETTWGGLARVDRDVPDGTDGVILELGANDRLRRVDSQVTSRSIDEIVRRLKARGIPVLLAGIRFSNTADPEVVRFNAVFPEIARRHGLVYHPDFYAGLASDPDLTIFDGMHPSAAGVRHIVGGILPAVERFLAAKRPGQKPEPGGRGTPRASSRKDG